MGESVLISDESDVHDDYSVSLKLAAIILVLLGLLSPVLISIYGYPGNYSFMMQSLLWVYERSNWGTSLYLFPFYYLFSMFPLLILRLVPASQIVRYYQGKTTRKRAIIAILIGDIYFLFVGSVMLLFAFMSSFPTLFIPLPFQMIAGLFILWRFSIPEPVTPWESPLETKPWWDEERKDVPDATDTQDDKDRLW